MDAHVVRGAILAAALASLGASYRTANFIVTAPTASTAEQIGKAAEKYRRELAIEWLGQEIRNWAQPCPITAHVGDHLGAGGATSFVFEHGEVFGWRMTIQGSQVRLLDSVLPHEVTHTIFATHFRQPLPRWADEGACTTVEHASEKAKQQTMLIDFLRTRRGIAFGQMFTMKDYPHDVMPLYSQGYSVARYLMAQGGKRKFLDFLADGLRDENWTRAAKKYYGAANLATLQNNWLDWVRKGSPSLEASTPALVAVNASAGERPGPRDSDLARGTDRAASDAPRPTESGSVYEVAAANPGALESSRPDGGWRAPRAAQTAAASASSDSSQTPREQRTGDKDNGSDSQLAQHQVTRPQGVQRPRQVILEWSRPFQAPDDASAARVAGGYPASAAN